MLVRRAFLAGSTVWMAAIPLAAFAASRAAASSAVYGFALTVYAIGHIVCHQLPARSFHLWGASLPVCARCTGIYVGAAAASIVIALAPRPSTEARFLRSSAKVDTRLVLLLATAPTAITVLFEWSTGVTPANWIRALAGVPLGAAVAWAIGMVN
jgi:uncharacterized membrane protein